MDLTLILIVGGAFLFIALIVGIVITVRSQRSEVEERVSPYVGADEVAQVAQRPTTTPLTEWMNKRVERSSYGDRISKFLARADLKLKPGEYVSAIIIVSIVLGLLLFFVGRMNPITGILGAIGGAFIPNMYVRSLQSKRLVKFSDQLGDMLSLMVNGLRAGYSTTQAMEAVSKELPPPICDEFRRVVQEMQLGVPMEKALDNLLRRIPSDDLDMVVTAINVQREVGGNLAEILDTISYTIRERVRIKGEIRVLTTQVMYSGKFLSILPLIVIGILYLMNPEYIMLYFQPESNSPVPCGFIALGLAALLIFMGYMVMTNIAKIEV
jgi:tight adherence protein B